VKISLRRLKLIRFYGLYNSLRKTQTNLTLWFITAVYLVSTQVASGDICSCELSGPSVFSEKWYQ
jgi:hypothetical protein